MSNTYNFTDADLLLSADKVTQFTNALATGGAGGIADPLQQLCDEAAADVARLTAGYQVDNISIFNFIRALATFKAYSNSGSPVPPDIASNRKDVWDELTAIAEGKRPNLPKIADPALQSRAGVVGSSRRIHGRMHGEGDCLGGGWI